jgi:hypothetical protein
MGTLPRQKILDFHDAFKAIPVTFNKEVIHVTGLQAKQIMLKCASDFFPCVVYSTSFAEAKIVANNKTGLFEKLKETNNTTSIKFSFRLPASGEQVSFLVTARVSAISPYGDSPDMTIFTLQYAQRPPDDLIEIMGRVIEATMNFAKRKDERINITPEALRKLRFATKDVGVTIQGVPRRCILRDISFGSARLVMVGVSKFLIDKPVGIKFDFNDPEESYSMNGKFTSADAVLDHKDMVVVNMVYDEPIPLMYKVRLNDYLGTVRETRTTAKPAAAAAVEAAAPDAPASPADGAATAASPAAPAAQSAPADSAAPSDSAAIPEEPPTIAGK